MEVEIYQVDAFTDRAFSGNPAGVCFVDERQPDEWMQSVASEMNLSETAFLKQQENGYELRWFTPKTEVDLCGHATLASAHILWETDRLKGSSPALFHTRSGLLTARRDGQMIEMDFPSDPPQSCQAPPELLEALDLIPLFVGKNSTDYLLEFASDVEVEHLEPDFRLLAKVPCRGVIVTARTGRENYDFISRFFAPACGIDEDPVTGSAHCALGPFWAERIRKSVLRGYQASARGGSVGVKVEGDRVKLSGHAVTILSGRLFDSPAVDDSEEKTDGKRSYQEKMEKQLDQWAHRIDRLLSRVESETRDGYQILARELQEKQKVARHKLTELKASSSEAWSELKPGLEHAWKDLREAIDRAASRFTR